MEKWKRVLLLLVPVVIIAFFVGYELYISDWEDEKPLPVISVIARGESGSERWRALDQGIAQACSEVSMEKPVITQIGSMEGGELERALRRETGKGSQGVIIVSGDWSAYASLRELSAPLSVVFIGSALEDIYSSIGADDYAMGIELADYIMSLDPEPGVAVLEPDRGSSDNMLRYEGLCDRLQELGIPPVQIPRDRQNGNWYPVLVSGEHEESSPPASIVAAVDNDTLEWALAFHDAADIDIPLCGIGSSDALVHALDSGSLQALIYLDEYGGGYMAAMLLAREMGLISEFRPVDVSWRLITRDTMYLEENERLIFSIIQ